MARMVPLEVRLADLPEMKSFFAAVADLIRVLGECDDLPQPVMDAIERLAHEVTAVNGNGKAHG